MLKKDMKNGCKIIWSENAIVELEKTIKYLEENWTNRELENLAKKTERVLNLISKNPELFPKAGFKNIRKAVVNRHNSIYYTHKPNNTIEILSFFSNRQNPSKRNLNRVC